MGTSSTMEYQYSKINTISTLKGKLKFNYILDGSFEYSDLSKLDPYRLESITLADQGNTMLSKYQFWYSATSILSETSLYDEQTATFENRRALQSIQKFDKNLALQEETSFLYDEVGSSTKYGYYDDFRYGNFLCENEQTASPKYATKGLLKRITFPTQGYVEYDFEANTAYYDRNWSGSPYHDYQTQYYGMTTETLFDTNISKNYTLTVTSPQDSYITVGASDLYFNTDNHGNPIPYTYKVMRGNNILTPISCSSNNIYKVFAGTYKVVMTGGASGTINQYTLETMPPPYKNEGIALSGSRVKMISSYDSDGTLVKSKIYEYQSFSNPLDSSGDMYYNDNFIYSSSSYDTFFLYKNVKETEISGNKNNGHIKYYFKTPIEYAQAVNYDSYPYYNLTSSGILERKEVYNSNDDIVESTKYEYNFQEIPNTPQIQTPVGLSVPSWIQYVKETNKSYIDQNLIQNIKEITYSPNNLKESHAKVTTHNNDMQESFTKYAQDLSDIRLINANMISIPLETEAKENGITLLKSKTVFGDVNHLNPTAVVTNNLAQNPETQMTFDLYDDKGNLVQVSNKAGISTTTIWGYHKTLPIAQIVGAKYSDISSLSVITTAVAASDADADNGANEAALLTALDNLRLHSALQQYPITVYTYDPLVGITNSISGNGIKVSYTYDASGRLSTVKDSNGKVLKENQYNYKH